MSSLFEHQRCGIGANSFEHFQNIGSKLFRAAHVIFSRRGGHFLFQVTQIQSPIVVVHGFFPGEVVVNPKSRNQVKLLFEDDITLCFIGIKKGIYIAFFLLAEMAENGNKRGYSCAGRDKYTWSLVVDGSPHIVDQEVIASL